MRDTDMVAAIVAGDPAGLAAAYERYAAGLHAYCRSLLTETAGAADAVRDTFSSPAPGWRTCGNLTTCGRGFMRSRATRACAAAATGR